MAKAQVTVPLDIPDIRVLKTELSKDGELIITIESTKVGTNCRVCGRWISKSHGYADWGTVRHLPVFGRPTYLRYRPKRIECQECEGHPTTVQKLEWHDPYSRYSYVYEEHLLLQLVGSTVSDVSIKERIAYDGVLGTLERRIETEVDVLGLDEIALKKGQRDYVTFNFMKRTLRAGLNLSLMGFAYWTADIFGLEGRTTPETHMRYAQWTLFTPVARYFWRPAQVDGTRYPWSHGPQTEASFQKHVDLRYRLLPYYYALSWQAHQTGIPILRPLILEFQDSPDLRDVYDQVMLGDRLMLCPVVEAGADVRKVHLPPGTWHDFWSEGSWEGPAKIELPAPIDRLPILVRGGTVLPMGPSIQHIPDEHRFDRLQLHCWPPYPARGLIYDDGGCTRAYQRGDYSTTEILLEDKDGSLSISIAAASGGFQGQYQSRQVEIILHRAPPPAKISLNDQTAVDWEYDASLEQTSLSIQCSVDQETQLQIFH